MFVCPPGCILLKLDYAKFSVSNLFFQKLWKKPLGDRLDSLVKKGLMAVVSG